MASLKATCASLAVSRVTRSAACARPALPARRVAVARAQINEKPDVTAAVTKAVAISSAAATFLYSGQAMAAQELVSLAAGDSRGSIIATLFVPALGWVAFNMLQPLNNQLGRMSEMKGDGRRSIATAVGLGAAVSMLMAQNADAATQIAELAEKDNRAGIIATLFVPALGWVGFNMLQPLGNQLGRMSEMKDEAKRSIVTAAAGLGAAATLLVAQNADAATQIAELAEKDNRAGIIATLFVPALGWVGFNMLQPLGNQLGRMSEMKDDARRSIVTAAAGLGAAATLLVAQNADAATQIAELAEKDNRGAIIATLFVPALGWVAFNMLQPLGNQLGRMSEMKDEAKRSIVTAAAGLGAAATLLVAQNADAATQIAELAEKDNRASIIATLFVPALGWVGFNMLQPLLNQLGRMSEMKEK